MVVAGGRGQGVLVGNYCVMDAALHFGKIQTISELGGGGGGTPV